MPFDIAPAELLVVMITAAMLIAVPVLVILAAKAILRPSQPTTPDPRAVLADRLARGEISRDEFDTAMRALGFSD